MAKDPKATTMTTSSIDDRLAALELRLEELVGELQRHVSLRLTAPAEPIVDPAAGDPNPPDAAKK